MRLRTGDPAAGTLCCKLSHRKAALLGVNQPMSVRMDPAVTVDEYQERFTETYSVF